MCHVDCQQAEEDEDEDMRSADEELAFMAQMREQAMTASREAAGIMDGKQ
jgi:hypothetical protein